MLPGTSLSDYLQMLGCLQSICVLSWRNLSRLMWLIVPEIFHHLGVVFLCLCVGHDHTAFHIDFFNRFNISMFFP